MSRGGFTFRLTRQLEAFLNILLSVAFMQEENYLNVIEKWQYNFKNNILNYIKGYSISSDKPPTGMGGSNAELRNPLTNWSLVPFPNI